MTAVWLLLLSALPAAAMEASGRAHQGAPVAAGVVRSREWLIRRAPQREEEFVGDVSYHKGPNSMSADWALLRHEPQIWQARGHVRMEHMLKSGDRIEVMGERAQFDQKNGQGWLIGPSGVTFQRIPRDGPPDQGSAVRLDWEGDQTARLSGNVHAWGPRLEMWGEQADFDVAQSGVRLSGGRPVLRVLEGDWTGAVQADTVAAKDKPASIHAEGRTQGWIRFKDKLEKLAQ
ncbi:MAG: hypothetical protein WC881_10035 [Elusimicrobiota bacterium]|jgi:lipopolysaccharide export system protein LptA